MRTKTSVYVHRFHVIATSKSIMSLGKGTSGFSPVSTVGMLAFLISFSTNPTEKRGFTIFNTFGVQVDIPKAITFFSGLCLLNFLSISSHLLTSFTNFRWKTFTSGLSCKRKGKKKQHDHYVSVRIQGNITIKVLQGQHQTSYAGMINNNNRP